MEPAVASPKAEDFRDAVAAVELEEQRPDNIVDSRTQAAASDNARHGFLRFHPVRPASQDRSSKDTIMLFWIIITPVRGESVTK